MWVCKSWKIVMGICDTLENSGEFFKKFLGDIGPFCWASDTLVLDFWWHLLAVSKPEWTASFALGRGLHVTCFLRFTSGATPANILVPSMAAEPFQSLVGLNTGIYDAADQCEPGRCPTNWTMSARLNSGEFKFYSQSNLDKLYNGNLDQPFMVLYCQDCVDTTQYSWVFNLSHVISLP